MAYEFDLEPTGAPRQAVGESDAAFRIRWAVWLAGRNSLGASLQVGIPAATTRFAPTAVGERLGSWSFEGSSALPQAVRTGETAGWSTRDSPMAGQAAIGEQAAVRSPDAPRTAYSTPGGGVGLALRSPADSPAPDRWRSTVLAATGFDTAWGTPPPIEGLAWNEGRFLYQPERGLEGLPYRAAERDGVYVQAYRAGVGHGGWGVRWVRVSTTVPDEARPYVPLMPAEASAAEAEVRGHALELRKGHASSSQIHMLAGASSIAPPRLLQTGSISSNSRLPTVEISGSSEEQFAQDADGRSRRVASIVPTGSEAADLAQRIGASEVRQSPGVLGAPGPVVQRPMRPCSSPVSVVVDPASIRVFIGRAVSEFRMTEAPARRSGRLSQLPNEPVVLAVESRVPYAVQHTCSCGSTSCMKETSVLARPDIEWETPTLHAGRARGARLGTHSVTDDDVHSSNPRVHVPGAAVLLLPPRLGPEDEANLNVRVTISVPAGRVTGGPAFTARLSVNFRVRRVWSPAGTSVVKPDQIPNDVILARQDRYEYEFDVSTYGDPQRVSVRDFDRRSCDCAPMEPGVESSLSMQPVESPPPTVVHAGDVVRIRWVGSSSWRADLRCESTECRVPPPIEVRADAALTYSWSVEQSVGKLAQIDQHDFVGPTTLDSIVIRVPSMPGPDYAFRAISVQMIASDAHGRSMSEKIQLEVLPRRPVGALLIVAHGGKLGPGDLNGTRGRGYNLNLESLGVQVADMLQSGPIAVESHLRILAQDQSTEVSASCETGPADEIARTVLEWIDRIVSAQGIVGPVIMLGHSWGANAIALACRVLERVGVGIDLVFAIDRTACGGPSKGGFPAGFVCGSRDFQPDAGTNVMLIDNVTAGGALLDETSPGVALGNFTRYRPVWCARINRNLVLSGIGHTNAEDDPRSVRFVLGEAVRLGGDLFLSRHFAVMNSRRPCTGVVEQDGRRLTMAKALLARLELAEPEVHGTQRSCEKPAGYEGR